MASAERQDPSWRPVDRLPALAPRIADSHKGDYGRVLIVAGSSGMSGAACLAGTAALRGGAGLVRIATPEGVCGTVAAYEPSYLTCSLPEDAEGRISDAAIPQLIELVESNDVVAIGPGIGQGPMVARAVTSLLAAARKPTVLDADGLNALGTKPDSLETLGSLLVLTPHPGEFARLLGVNTATVQSRRIDLAVEFSRRHQNVLVLKGHRSVVTDGQRVYVNATGNPGMATGGSGDVLTGLIAALAAQRLGPFDAAVLGTYVHGLAGDLAARQFGQVSLIASDLLQFLPAALRTVERVDN